MIARNEFNGKPQTILNPSAKGKHNAATVAARWLLNAKGGKAGTVGAGGEWRILKLAKRLSFVKKHPRNEVKSGGKNPLGKINKQLWVSD